MIDWQQITYRLCRTYSGQKNLAKAAGMSVRAIGELSCGGSKAPKLNNALRLLELYSKRVEHIPGAAELAERVK